LHITARSEKKAAQKRGRKPKTLSVPLKIETLRHLARNKGYSVRLKDRRTTKEMLDQGLFCGVVRLQIGRPGDPVNDLVTTETKNPFERRKKFDPERFRVPTIIVSGSDLLTLTVKDKKGRVQAGQKVRLLTDGKLELLDQTFKYEKTSIHLGERFNIRLTDLDQDKSDERDIIKVQAKTSREKSMVVELEETMHHSGTFTGTVKPNFIKNKNPESPSPLKVDFGDTVSFVYTDEKPLSQDKSLTAKITGKIHHGADGRVVGFTKHFKDSEMAVRTRFLLAEALFEMAKDHRKLGKKDLAKEEIAKGKNILEEALRDYPNTSLMSQGNFLLANLAQEMDRHNEAVARYAEVISRWPDSEYAARSQFKKAVCLEAMKQYEQACEEYVKLIYIYTESPLVANATIRLGTYYYKNKKYKTAGDVFFKFQKRNPNHKLAAKTLLLSGKCYLILNQYEKAAMVLTRLVGTYRNDNIVRPKGMYWLGEAYFKNKQYVDAYQTFKKLTWDYPASDKAKIARGRLMEEVFSKIEQ